MKLTIDRNIWLRGEGSDESRLYRKSDGKMCCVGIYLHSCGIPLKSLTGAVASSVDHDKVPKWLIGTARVGDIYWNNDRLNVSEGERERTLTHMFKEQGVDVEFIN